MYKRWALLKKKKKSYEESHIHKTSKLFVYNVNSIRSGNMKKMGIHVNFPKNKFIRYGYWRLLVHQLDTDGLKLILKPCIKILGFWSLLSNQHTWCAKLTQFQVYSFDVCFPLEKNKIKSNFMILDYYNLCTGFLHYKIFMPCLFAELIYNCSFSMFKIVVIIN